MESFTWLRFHPPPGTDKRRGRRVLAGLLALGIIALVACGEPAAPPTAIAEDCWEAIAAGDTEAAMDLFIDTALVTEEQTIFDGKDRIRYWIDNDIAFLRKGAECSEWSNVEEGADRLNFYERCTIGEVLWEGQHTLYFTDGKIQSWTMTFTRIE